MALTYTPPSDIGESLKPFSLPRVDGGEFSTKDLKPNQVLCVMFICNHCPYVKAVEDRILDLARSFANENVQFVGICANDPSDYPEDAPENLLKRTREKNYPFPYLFDSTQEVAKSFGAVCTPDIFLYDQNQKLFYRGRIDDSWRDASKVQRQELKEAIELALKGSSPPKDQIPSMGCSIKWMS